MPRHHFRLPGRYRYPLRYRFPCNKNFQVHNIVAQGEDDYDKYQVNHERGEIRTTHQQYQILSGICKQANNHVG